MRLFLVALFYAVCAFSAQAAQPAPSAQPTRHGLPSVTIVYSPSLDTACSMVRGGAIKDEWIDELQARKGEFDALWASVGPKLMQGAEAITGKAFPSGLLTARLTLCNVASQSFVGISVNMRYALQSFTASPVPLRYKVDTLFHELMHGYLSSQPRARSELLTAHAAESECVRNHLHLLALQKAVLLKLQEPEALRQVILIDGQLPSGCYKRAWALVNATDDGYLTFVGELKK